MPQAPPELPEDADVLSVADLNKRVKSLLDAQPGLQDVWLRGELSNYSGPHHSSGHLYFRLKDERAEVDCVMWRSDVHGIDFEPEDGMEVLLHGSAGLYERGGRFQFYADRMQPAGVGDLHLRFMMLKRELAEQGLFEEARKQAIPSFALAIGVVTSRGAAAFQDVLNVLRRRSPHVHVLLADCKVQGEGASATVASAIDRLNRYARQGHALDVIIVTRGGGSLEDLWAFNEEPAVRAVAESRVPVISGVGHETDTTLVDLAADERAPTPSAAAELAAPSRADVLDGLEERRRLLGTRLSNLVRYKRSKLDGLAGRPVLTRPEALFAEARQRTDDLATRLPRAVEVLLERSKARLSKEAATLDALSPLKVLARGYAVAEHDGHAVRSIEDVDQGDPLDVRVADGSIETEVRTTKEAPK